MWTVVGALVVVACQQQSTATYSAVQYAESVEYVLTNLIVGIPKSGGQPMFLLDISPGAVSTTTVELDGNSEQLTFPNARFVATFETTSSNVIAFAQLLQAGATMCRGEIFFGSRVPVACTTASYARAMCTDACRYAAIRAGKVVLVEANAHLHVPAECDGEIDIMLHDGGIVRVCESQNAFNPLAMGASIHQAGAVEQTIYFPQHIDDGPIAAMFVIALIIALVVWVGNAPVILFLAPTAPRLKTVVDSTKVSDAVAAAALLVQSGNTDRAIAWIRQTPPADLDAQSKKVAYVHAPARIQTITMAVSDLAVTAVSTSIITLMDAADVYVPPETTIATGVRHVWLSTYIGVILVGSSIALATGTIHYLQQDRVGIAVLMRVSLEVTLLAAVFFHLPPTMGATFRRTIGFFLGVTTCVIVSRDTVGVRATWSNAFQYITTHVWAAAAIANAGATMILPAFYQSAGIQNSAAIAVAAATAVGTIAGTRIVVRVMATRAKNATPLSQPRS